MSWTYSGNPSASALAEVRFLIADTDSTKAWTLQDGEISYALGLYSANPPVIGQNFLAAAVCAETILAKLKAVPESKSVGDLSLTWGSQFKFYESQAYRLRQRAALQGVAVYCGGTSATEKASVNAEPDRVGTAVKIDGMNIASPVNLETSDSIVVGP